MVGDGWVHGVRRPCETLADAKQRATRERISPAEGWRMLDAKVRRLRERGLDDLEIASRLGVAKCWPRLGMVARFPRRWRWGVLDPTD